MLKFYTLLLEHNRTLSKAYNCYMDLKKNFAFFFTQKILPFNQGLFSLSSTKNSRALLSYRQLLFYARKNFGHIMLYPLASIPSVCLQFGFRNIT
jgi:hypothetical protein